MKAIKCLALKTILTCICMFVLISCHDDNRTNANITYDTASGYTIITDTISIKAQNYIPAIRAMRLSKTCRYRDGYMCLFSFYNYTSQTTELGLGEGKIILFLSKKGKEIVQIPMPDDYKIWKSWYHDIQVVRDTLYFLNNDSKSVNYWAEEAQEWHNADRIPSYPPADEKFLVRSIDHGEWGSYAQFHERTTGMDYLFASEMLNAFWYDSAYYIVEPYHISKVTDPHHGWKKDDSLSYTKWYKVVPPAGIVVNTRYNNYIDYEFSDDHTHDTIFCDQFLRHGQLHYLIQDSGETYIAKYKRAKHSTIEKVLSLGDIHIGTTNRNRFDTTAELIRFKQDWQTDGLLDITDDTIRLMYLSKEYDTLQHTGREAFAEVIRFIQNNLGTVTIDSVRAFEHSIGGQFEDLVFETNSKGFVTEGFSRKMGFMHGSTKEEETKFERINCFNILDEHDTFWIAYCYNQQTLLLTSAFAEISGTRLLNGDANEARLHYKQIDSILTRCLSVPPVAEGKWIKDNISYELKKQNPLRLYIHRCL